MTEKEFYTCKYCFKEFEPQRRRVQKYCSDTCRSKAHHARKTTTPKTQSTAEIAQLITSSPLPQETISLAGVGNAALGTIIADSIKSVFTADDNKSVTKADLKLLLDKLGYRYQLIKNMPANFKGEYPYYDLVDGVVVYLGNSG